MRFLASCFLVVMLLSTSASAQSLSPNTTWVNDGGSEFTITAISSDGAISGTYVNKVEGFECQNEPMAVTGWVEGNLLSFSVRWKNANVDCKSITTWTGYFASNRIYTDWDLIYTAANTGLPTHLKQSNVFRPK